jgi:hypothetical protein
MTDDIKTLREASHVIKGINDRLSIMIAVFSATLALQVFVYWKFSDKFDVIVASLSEIKISSESQGQQLKVIVGKSINGDVPMTYMDVKSMNEIFGTGVLIDQKVFDRVGEILKNANIKDTVEFYIDFENVDTLHALAQEFGVPLIYTNVVKINSAFAKEKLQIMLLKYGAERNNIVILYTSDQELSKNLKVQFNI